jgi:protein TonB
MSVHLRYCLFILLIAAGCNKAEVRVPPPPPPKDPETVDDVFPDCDPELTAEYKGGTAAWLKFLSENLTYPDSAINAEIQGTIRVSFAIEKDGRVIIIQPPGGPGVLQNEAVRVISLSNGSWQPAMQGGRTVKSYQTQPIVFELRED